MKRIWKWLLIIFIIVIALFLPPVLTFLGEWLVGAGFLQAGFTLGAWGALAASAPWWVGAAVGVGLSYLIDPATTTEIITDVAAGAAKVGGKAIDVVLGFASQVLNSPLGLAAAAFGLYWLFGRDKEKDKEKAPSVRSGAAATNVERFDGPQPSTAFSSGSAR